MENHQLPEGTLLDERYLVQEVLGEGGFGITYAAVNQRIRLKVAVKELFWKDHVRRAPGNSRALEVISEEEKQDYEALKEKFMREARLLRDFDQEPGVVRVLDYFEANHTAYLVMEYLEGITFRQYIKKHGVFEPEDLFRRLLPLLESLGHIHGAGVIHRDISPDNLMILKDGNLKLLDFGAARNYKTAAGGQYTAIAKENYAPGEQFDRKGNQGPWTDIYALCATIYEGVTGAPPESAVQRMFLDELKKPSQTGISIEAAYEKIIMKGLAMKPEDRYTDTEQMKKAVEAALPLLTEAGKGQRRMAAGILTGIGLAGLAIGIFWYREYDRTHKFRNIDTETFWLKADGEMTAEEFAEAQMLVEERLAEMAGEDNYIMEVEGDAVTVTLPLAEFEGQEIAPVLEEQFVSVNAEKPFQYEYEIQAVWEDPAASLTAGENQCLPEEVEGAAVTQIYASNYDSAAAQMTRGEWSNLFTDMKVRLDSLNTPYAVGYLYGDEESIVVKLAAEKTGERIRDSLGRNALPYIRSRWNCDSVPLTRNPYREGGTELLSVEEGEDGSCRLVCRLTDPEAAAQLQEVSEYSLENGETELYLDMDFGDYIAGAALTGPVTDGTLEFTDIYLRDGGENIEAQRSLLEYFCAVVNDTSLPEQLFPGDRMLQDEEGKIVFGADDEAYYGVVLEESPPAEAFRALTEQMEAEGWEISRKEEQTAWIQLGISADEGLIREGFSRAAEFIRKYGLADGRGSFYLCLTGEPGEERCRIVLSDSVTGRNMSAKLVMVGETMEPYFQEAGEAWEKLSLGGGIQMEEPMLEKEP